MANGALFFYHLQARRASFLRIPYFQQLRACLQVAAIYALIVSMMPPTKAEREAIRKFASSGGKARAAKLTKKRLREIAMMGVRARAAKRNGS